jgi:signal transduction histidine kinase
VGLADFFSHTDLALSVFYTVPIALTLWLPPRRHAGTATFATLALALGATLLALFLGADATGGPGPRPALNDDPVAVGNRLVGALSQLVVAWTVVKHRRARAMEREMAAKLQLALQATDEFVAVASHELKTPLTGARGYAQLLLRRAQGGQLPGLDARGAEALALIDNLLGRLHALMDDLLHVSRVHSGRLDLKPERVDLAALAPEVAHDLERQSPQHTIAVAAARDAVWAWADARCAEQIMTNLIGNAVKYSPSGGQIVVEVSDMPCPSVCSADEQVCERADAGHRASVRPPMPADADGGAPVGVSTAAEVMVFVRDEGIGIPLADRGRLFERFVRASNAVASSVAGTGLGLYLCRMLTEALGGRIWLVASEEGRGSTFAFSLPAWPVPSCEDRDSEDDPRRTTHRDGAHATDSLMHTRRTPAGHAAWPIPEGRWNARRIAIQGGMGA